MNEKLQKALNLIKSGDKQKGRQLLVQILGKDPSNETAWLWMSSVVTNDKQRYHCLKQVLKLNPNNQTAQKGLLHLDEKLGTFQQPRTSESSNRSEADQSTDLVAKLVETSLPGGTLNTSDEDILNQSSILEFDLFGKIYHVAQPRRLNVTEKDRSQFERASMILDQYHGLPEQLQAAFEEFIQIESIPLFHAGLTLFLVTWSFVRGFTFDAEGLKAAKSWLVDAQEIAPDEKGVLLAGIKYHLAQKEYPECDELVKRGQSLYPTDFDLHFQRISLLGRQGTVLQCEKALRQVHRQLELTVVQKQALYKLEARIYLTKRVWKKAVKSYKRVTKFEPDNPWIWHNLSIAQLETMNSFTAYVSNRKALSIMDFGAARRVQKKVRTMLIIQTGAVLGMIIILAVTSMR